MSETKVSIHAFYEAHSTNFSLFALVSELHVAFQGNELYDSRKYNTLACQMDCVRHKTTGLNFAIQFHPRIRPFPDISVFGFPIDFHFKTSKKSHIVLIHGISSKCI